MSETKTLPTLVEEIKTVFESFVTNADAQAEKGVKASGQRARKASLELGKLLKEFRSVSVEASK